jgi:hypothetical protein
MSNPQDIELHRERVSRRTALLAGAARLEQRAHELIIEAHELRKLAEKLFDVIEKEKQAS